MTRIMSFITAVILSFSFIFSWILNYNIDKMTLTNKNADKVTQNLYSYICDTYKNGIITGQQESYWLEDVDYEFNYIEQCTGRLPAMRVFDFIEGSFDEVVERAEEWWSKGGIVTICFHCNTDFEGTYEECKNNEIDNWELILTEGTRENREFIAKMDKAGFALKKLQEKGIPVLWRPFHEFDGQWFWWGKGGPENFKKLWIMMYDHFTNDLELNNLIWVLGYSHNGGLEIKDWYPGDKYCDIVGADSYECEINGAEKRLYDAVIITTKGKKPLIFHECGHIPSVDEFEKIPWISFMTWHTQYLIDTNSPQHLSEIYNSEYAITLDELPDFVTYGE